MAVEETVADEVDEKPERSIREELESSLSEVTARQETERAETKPETIETSAEGRAEGRARDATGKFAKTAGELGSQPETSAPQRADPAGLPPPDARGQQPPVALPAPNGWKAEEKALWAKVPPDVQHVINRRETDVARKIAEQDEVRLVGNHFMQAANEHAPLIQQRGGNPVALFREFLGILGQIQNSDPASRAQVFRNLAAQNGVDLRQLGFPGQPNAQGQQQPNVPIDQIVQRSVNERFQAMQQAQAQERERAEMQATNSEIESFRSKVDAHGQQAYPYFDHVTSLMASILGGGVATSLEEAYQLAVKAHPETSQLIAKAEQAQVKAKEEARLKAQSKRRAAGSIRGGPGSSSVPNGKDRSIRDELTAAFEEARGRV